jgi:CRP-like cAMP-binding protein
MASDGSVRSNLFLNSLPPDVRAALTASGRRLSPTTGQFLLLDERQGVYFPDRGLISLLWRSPEGRVVEAGLVDQQGAVGLVEAVAQTEIGFECRALTQGTGWLVPSPVVRTAISSNSTAAVAGWRCTAAMVRETRQATACRSFHNVDARLADALLNFSERSDTKDLSITQEVLSWCMGVCRTTVTLIIGQLDAAGVIRSGRCRISIVDFASLEARSCGCRRAGRTDQVALTPTLKRPANEPEDLSPPAYSGARR